MVPVMLAVEVDIVDFNGSFLSRVHDIAGMNPIILVVTKNVLAFLYQVDLMNILSSSCIKRPAKSNTAQDRSNDTSNKADDAINLANDGSRIEADTGNVQLMTALIDGKFDMGGMREAVAKCIMMHEHPFSIVEEEGFNMMQKYGMSECEMVSCVTIKKDCIQIYDTEKKRLMQLLKTVNKVSFTTYLWRSSNQRIEYMLLTAHFIDSNWRLQKRVISFVHIPPPRRGVEIANSFFKCLKGWGIGNKVFTISVDNASNNDVAIRVLKDTFQEPRGCFMEDNCFMFSPGHTS
ncbi:hypothetical protein CCACVL1_24336 [Corchorus capsularis]|uniref:Uncharacterized protein n=1 Tax=Corchorus capsularis TaxID=210143 RepID=A0A1R3GQ67_COCAP|nr:hypothetical protein CCACVL1_24336 [Corchorus capsularis]